MADLQSFLSLTQALIGQQNRLLKIDTPQGDNLLLPQRLIAHERLGRGYEYTVDLLSSREGIELKKLIAQPVTLWVQQDDNSYLPVHGYVHTAKRLGSDGQFTFCQISFAPWLHFLKFRKDARIWQDKTTDDILSEVFDQHPQAQGNYRFDIVEPALPRSYCTQYETDWNFAQRLMEEEGWYSYHEQKPGGSGHVLVITDNTDHLPPQAQEHIAFHGAGTQDELNKIVHWSASRSLAPSQFSTKTDDYKAPSYPKDANDIVSAEHGDLPMQLEVYEYTGAYTYSKQEQGDKQALIRVQEWESSMKRFSGVSGVRSLPAGYWFTLSDHPAHNRDSEDDRQFMVVAVEWLIENNLPLSNAVKDFPGSLKQKLDAFKAAIGRGSDINAEGRLAGNEHTGHCFNRFEVQRRKVPYRSPFEHHKPVIHTQTAIVVGPEGEEIYTDHLNRVKVQFRWDRQNPGDERASCWVRVSYPNAGQNWGNINTPRTGQELLISFINSDPDRPVATGRLFNEEQTPQWHSNGRLSGIKSKEFSGSGFNQLVLDDTTGQNRVHLHSTNTHAQLNLGYLVNQNGNDRTNFYGLGFSLKTDDYGAFIAHKGMYISTFGRPGPNGTQLDTTEATSQLKAGAELTKNLSDTASKAGAETLTQDGLKQFIDATQDNYEGEEQGNANRFKEPILLAASPAGIGLVTPKGTHVHSGEETTLSSGTDTVIATGKSLLVSVAEKISLFAFKAGLKLFAAKGKVEIQAQSDDLDIIAEKVLRILSTTGRLELSGKDEVLITCGGSFIRINSSGITQGTGGKWEAKASQKSLAGPERISYEMPLLPATTLTLHKKYTYSQ